MDETPNGDGNNHNQGIANDDYNDTAQAYMVAQGNHAALRDSPGREPINGNILVQDFCFKSDKSNTIYNSNHNSINNKKMENKKANQDIIDSVGDCKDANSKMRRSPLDDNAKKAASNAKMPVNNKSGKRWGIRENG